MLLRCRRMRGTGRGWCQNSRRKLRQGTHLPLLRHSEVSVDPSSPRRPSELSTVPGACTGGPRKGTLLPTHSRECSALAAGSAKAAGCPVGTGHVTAPLPPPSLGDSGMGKIPHRGCQIFPYLMGLPSSLALALRAMAPGCTYTQAGPAPPPRPPRTLGAASRGLALPVEAPPTAMSIRDGTQPPLQPWQGPQTGALGSAPSA